MSAVTSVAGMMGTPAPPVPTSLHGQVDRIRRSRAVGGGSIATPMAAAMNSYSSSTSSLQPKPRGKVSLSSTVPSNAAWGGMADTLASGNTDVQMAYSEEHRINRIYECLLFALAVDQPDDARGYLKDKLAELKQRGLVHWDMLIPPERRPPLPQRAYWLVRDDPWDDDKPTEEMFHRAYTYNNQRLLRLGLRQWDKLIKQRRDEKKEHLRKLVLAVQHRRKVVFRKVLHAWGQWSKTSITKRQMVYEGLVESTRLKRMRPVLRAWRTYAENARTAAQWFAKMSQGGEEASGEKEQQDFFTRMLKWDLRVMIFQYLTVKDLCRCSQVCRAWQDVVQDRALWESTNLTSLADKVNDNAVEQIVDKHFSVITNINMLGCVGLTSTGCVRLAQCSNIQDLNLSGCRGIRDDGLKKIVRECQCLLYLNLSFCKVTDLSMRYLGMYCEELAFLSLANCSELTDAGATAIRKGTKCKKLQWLDLSGCRNFSTEGLQELIAGCGATLGALILNHITTLRGAVLAEVARQCHDLQHISILGCQNINDRAIKQLSHCHGLRRFAISDNALITGAGLRGMVKGCKNLTNVMISKCAKFGNEGLSALSQCNLAFLDVSDCPSLTEGGVKSLCEGGIGPRRNLQHVDFSRCYGITAAGYFHIPLRLHMITRLKLKECRQIDDTTFECIQELRRLTLIDISGCSKITDEALIMIGATPRPTLRHVYLSDCNLVTDIGVEGLVRKCHSLFSIDLSGCNLLTDDAIYQLTYSNHHITYLNLLGLNLLTDISVHCICGTCKVISYLNLFNVVNITAEAIEKHLRLASRTLQTLVITAGFHIPYDSVAKFQKTQMNCTVFFERSTTAHAQVSSVLAAMKSLTL